MVRPVTVHEVVVPLAVVHVCPPLEVTVYLVIAAPPFETGAVHDTTDWVPPPAVAATPVGGPGTVDGVPVAGADAGPTPMALVAVTVKE